MENNILNNLIHMNASDWNEYMGSLYELSSKEIEDYIISGSYEFVNDIIKHEVNKQCLDSFLTDNNSYVPTENDFALSIPTDLDKYVMEFISNKQINKSLTLTGKMIIGVKFIGCNLNNSYFINCTFYNCRFENCSLDNTVCTNCKFIKTQFTDCFMSNMIIGRTRFTEGLINECTLDNSTFNDDIFLMIDIKKSSIKECKFLYSSISDGDWIDNDFGLSQFIQSVFINGEMSDSNYNRSKFLDCIIIRIGFNNSIMDNISVSCTTVTMSDIPDRYSHYFRWDDSHLDKGDLEWSNI